MPSLLLIGFIRGFIYLFIYFFKVWKLELQSKHYICFAFYILSNLFIFIFYIFLFWVLGLGVVLLGMVIYFVVCTSTTLFLLFLIVIVTLSFLLLFFFCCLFLFLHITNRNVSFIRQNILNSPMFCLNITFIFLLNKYLKRG